MSSHVERSHASAGRPAVRPSGPRTRNADRGAVRRPLVRGLRGRGDQGRASGVRRSAASVGQECRRRRVAVAPRPVTRQAVGGGGPPHARRPGVRPPPRARERRAHRELPAGPARAVESGPDGPHAANPRLIVVRISGYGQTGPLREQPGFGTIAEAAGGLRYITGEPGGPPTRVGLSLGDSIASMHALVGALIALHERERSGLGQVVDVALTESLVTMLEVGHPRVRLPRDDPRADRQHRPQLGADERVRVRGWRAGVHRGEHDEAVPGALPARSAARTTRTIRIWRATRVASGAPDELDAVIADWTGDPDGQRDGCGPAGAQDPGQSDQQHRRHRRRSPDPGPRHDRVGRGRPTRSTAARPGHLPEAVADPGPRAAPGSPARRRHRARSGRDSAVPATPPRRRGRRSATWPARRDRPPTWRLSRRIGRRPDVPRPGGRVRPRPCAHARARVRQQLRAGGQRSGAGVEPEEAEERADPEADGIARGWGSGRWST